MTDENTTPEILKILSENEFFADIKPEYLEFLASSARFKHGRAGELLFCQGQPAKSFYLAMSGEITIEVPAIQGPGLQLQKLGRGQVMGWSWMIDPYRWDFQARIILDIDLIEFDGEAILAECERDNAFGFDLFRRFTHLMSERLSSARRRMMDQWDPPGFA